MLNWLHIDDDSFPGFRLKVPLMIVLESLKHDCPTLRRVGETWMRCSLRSYIRYVYECLFFYVADVDPTGYWSHSSTAYLIRRFDESLLW